MKNGKFHVNFTLLGRSAEERASAEIQGEFFRPNSQVNFAGDFWGGFLQAFFLGKKNRRKKSTQKSTAKFKSEFGSFAAKIHCKDLSLALFWYPSERLDPICNSKSSVSACLEINAKTN